MWNALTARLPIVADPVTLLLVFFIYSFSGYILECIVLSVEKRRLVVDRGFTNHLPLCIIYGFGAIGGVALLGPLRANPVLLFCAGALVATLFEYMTARLQLHLFGSFWWDYSEKPMNYKGILCLESTIGWGVAAILVVRYVHGGVVMLARMVPKNAAAVLVLALAVSYLVDFYYSARTLRASQTTVELQEVPLNRLEDGMKEPGEWKHL